MKTRIERAIEQRTAMLAGVSHDLRTILTRFKLELALIGDTPEVEAMKRDVDEMARMLEAYLAFARGDLGEQSAQTDMAEFLEELKDDVERDGHQVNVVFHGPPIVTVRPAAFKRCLANLVSNAARFAHTISITGHRDHRWLTVHHRRRRPGHSGGHARGCVQAVPAARRRAQPGPGRHRPWAWRSPATSPARTAATSCSATARSAACARRCGCRCRRAREA